MLCLRQAIHCHCLRQATHIQCLTQLYYALAVLLASLPYHGCAPQIHCVMLRHSSHASPWQFIISQNQAAAGQCSAVHHRYLTPLRVTPPVHFVTLLCVTHASTRHHVAKPPLRFTLPNYAYTLRLNGGRDSSPVHEPIIPPNFEPRQPIST